MELKVRALEAPEQKSVQEVEQELLEKHEEKFEDSTKEVITDALDENVQQDVKESEKKEDLELNESDVLSYIGKRYGKQINSFDELISERESAEEMPEDVAAYFKYKKETGRGIEDYVKLQRDFDSMNPDNLLREYLLATEEGLDPEDIDSIMDEYSYDEDLDDEAVIKKTKLAKKKTIAKAKKFFNEQKELYKQPLESRVVGDSNAEELAVYKQYLESAKTQQEEGERKRSWFIKKTDEVFNDDFKGFDFNLDDKKITFSPNDSQSLKKAQETPMNFINKYLDEDGLINDAVGYHKALAIAMNPDKFAKFFYEQGKSEATEDVMRKTKNINMTERKATETTSRGDFKVRSVNPDSGRGLKIRSIKKS